MSHFALLWKARTIEKYRQNYENEKINSILLAKAEMPEKSMYRRFKHYSIDMKKHLSRTFSKWYPEGTTVSNFIINFRDMKFPHILLRSAFGFVWGLILTYLCFIFLVFQLSISLINATVISSFIGILLTLGLTLSNRMRCLIFLLIPQLFSRVGRYTLTCYALVLILTGPATNTLKNLEVLSESMACSQEQIKLNVRQLNESINKPFNSIKDAISVMMDKMKRVTMKLKLTLVKINRLMITVASIIQSNYAWLETIAKKCNQYIGTPYERCSKMLPAYAAASFQQNNNSLFSSLIDLAKLACDYVNNSDDFCVAPDYAEETFLATMIRKLKTFSNRIKSMLYIHIKIQHSYTFVGNISRTPSQVAAGIVTEIRNRADPIFTWLSWSSCVTSLFLLLIIFRAKYYQYMYETRSRFDNRFITKEFRELDLRRQREGRDTVLPLNRRERAKYVTTTSFRLVASEKLYLNRSVVFMLITTFKLLIHIVADYSLYWVLDTIQHHGGHQTKLGPGIPESGVEVIGRGFVASFLKSLFHILDVPLLMPPMSSANCLPNPYLPDFKRYGQIGVLILLLWLFALFEPYGLRMRHLIMGHYRPERAKARAIWLYHHILRTRGSFMKFARRKLHKEYKYSSFRDMTFTNILKPILLPIEFLLNFLGVKIAKSSCLLCNITQDCEGCNSRLIRCGVRKCPGVYCHSCFTDIGMMCSICMSPADYGDLSDVSLEKGSSDDDSDSEDERSSKRKLNKEPIGDLNKPSTSKKDDHDIESDEDDDDFYPQYTEAYPLLKVPINKNQPKASSNVIDHKEEQNEDTNREDKIDNNYKEFSKYEQCYFFKESIRLTSIEYGKASYVEFDYTYEINIYANPRPDINNEVMGKYKILYRYSFSKKRIKKTRLRSISACRLKFIYPLNSNKIKCRKKGPQNTKTNSKNTKDKTSNNDKKTSKETSNQAKDKPNNNKDVKGKKKAENNADDKKEKKDKKKEKDSSVTTKKTKTKSSNYFQHIIIKFIPCTDSRTTKLTKCALSPSSNTCPTKKHNRKRKRTKSKSPTRYNKQVSRDYRISSYLSELEWIKPKEKDKDGSTSLNNMNQNAQEDEVVEDVCLLNDSHIKIYDVLIPKLQLNFSNESLNKKEAKTKFRKTPHAAKEKPETQKIVVRKLSSLSRLPKHLKQFIYNTFTTNSLTLTKKTNKMPSEFKRTLEITRRKHNHDMEVPRTMKYFSSAHPDFDEIHKDQNSSEVTNLDSLLSSVSDYSVFPNEISKRDDVGDKIDTKRTEGNKENLTFIKEVPNTDEKRSTDTGWSPLKCTKGPLSIMKGLYSSLFIGTKSSGAAQTLNLNVNSEKSVLACPNVCTCACQKNFTRPPVHNRHVQIPTQVACKPSTSSFKWRMKKAKTRNAQVDTCKSTCTCATQHYFSCRDVGTYKNLEIVQEKLSESQLESELSSTQLETTTTSVHSNTSIRSESACSESSIFTSKTDTTLCSLATVKTDYEDCLKTNKFKKLANQATSTDVAKVCDVSTVTDDWWSPLIEKKTKSSKLVSPNVRIQRVRNKGIMTTVGRIVKFKSHAQIIPRTESVLLIHEDILSPSRYLVESQKYYNELFSSRYYSPHVLSMSGDRQRHKTEKKASKVSSRCNYRLNRKTKRLEDCYSPRRWKRHNN